MRVYTVEKTGNYFGTLKGAELRGRTLLCFGYFLVRRFLFEPQYKRWRSQILSPFRSSSIRLREVLFSIVSKFFIFHTLKLIKTRHRSTPLHHSQIVLAICFRVQIYRALLSCSVRTVYVKGLNLSLGRRPCHRDQESMVWRVGGREAIGSDRVGTVRKHRTQNCGELRHSRQWKAWRRLQRNVLPSRYQGLHDPR